MMAIELELLLDSLKIQQWLIVTLMPGHCLLNSVLVAVSDPECVCPRCAFMTTGSREICAWPL